MGWWGERAKDGDQPLDLLYLFEQQKGGARTFVKKQIEEVRMTGDESDKIAVVGLITLLVEKGKKFSYDTYRTAFEWSDCEADKNLFKALAGI